nr:MAG TPA: hypothetical protein [Caudoviricetes sp.]
MKRLFILLVGEVQILNLYSSLQGVTLLNRLSVRKHIQAMVR